MREIRDELVYAWVARRAQESASARMVKGFRTILPGLPDNAETIRDKLSAALDLIERIDVHALHQANLRFRGILVADLAGEDAKYLARSHTCLLDADHVSEKPAWRVAMSLVHQLTHARLIALGIPYNTRFKARVESVCVDREIEFAARAGVSELKFHTAVVELEESFFSSRRRRNRQQAAMIRNGLPRFLARRPWLAYE